MPDKKKQHFIPKFYMKNFSVNKTISLFNIKGKEVINNVPYKNQCYKDYFYGKDVFWENYLAEKETAWSNAIQSVLSKQALTEETITLLKEFALFQYMRTNAMDSYRKQERLESIIEIGKQIYLHRGWTFDDNALKECKEYAKQKATPIENLQLAKEAQKFISDLSVLVISYSTKRKLITSDMPVLAINPFHSPSVGLAVIGLLIFFPVSPSTLVVLYDSKMYPKYKNQCFIKLNNEKEVLNLNVYQLISAENILFGIDSSEFRNFNKSHWNARNKNRNIKPISTLGPNGKKLIISRTRPNIYDC